MTDRSMISIHGDQVIACGSHVLFLINGRPVRKNLENGISSEILETFPVNIIERIEVIKGPGSVLYGSNAFSGVINIITEKSEKTGLSINGLGGTGGAYGTSGDVKISVKDFKLLVAGRYLNKPDWDVNYSRVILTPAKKYGSLYSKDWEIPNTAEGAYLAADYKNLSLI